MIEKDLATGRESEAEKSALDDHTRNSKDGIRSQRMAPDAEVIASKGKRAPSKRIVVPE